MNKSTLEADAANKPIILIATLYYLPGYRAGGPIKSIANLISEFKDEFDFYILTSDRDVGDSSPYGAISHNGWTQVEFAKVYYLNVAQITFKNIFTIIQILKPHVIYLNSFFDPIFTHRILWLFFLKKLANIPIVIAPRGEFSLGALASKSWKKIPFIFISKKIGLFKKLIWQASSQLEMDQILNVMGKIARNRDVMVAPDLVAKVKINSSCSNFYRKVGQPLKVCFLSRIVPAKNLKFALEVLKNVDAEILFNIYGPVEDAGYWDGCKALISKLPSCIQVSYHGSVEPKEIEKVFGENDLFFLPTKGENFGHVIQEALASGLPVLISDQTPWGWVVEKGVGWAFSLKGTEDFVRVLEECAHGWSEEKWRNTSIHVKKVLECVESREKVLKQNRELFNRAILYNQ